jgi:formate hydrogenlyase transcriptional activator
MGTPPRIDLLLDITERLIRCRSLRDFDDRLATSLSKYLAFDKTGLFLYSRSTNSFSSISKSIFDPTLPGLAVAQLPAEGTLGEAAVLAGRAMLCPDTTAGTWPEAITATKAGLPPSSVVVAPLVLRENGPDSRGQALGVIAGVAIGRPEALSEEHRQLMEDLGIHLASLLETVLASEERDAMMAINRRVVLGSMTIEQLMRDLRNILGSVIPYDMIGLVKFIHESKGPWFEIQYIEGVGIDLEALRRFPFERMAPAELAATGKPFLSTGHNDQHFPEAAYFESVGVLSGMLCPLTWQGALYGFLGIGSRRYNAFSERDLALAEQIGHQLSQAINNITAYEELRRLKDQLERENLYLREEIGASVGVGPLVGKSRALQQTLKAIEQVAPTDSTVLITGETGTGKELVAQAIHRLSPYKDKPFIKVNCAALPPALIESELFGHEKGAFTGAVSRKIGRFELADGGTLFLDEVGDIPLDIQVKLLRVLETKELERVGGQNTITLRVRVLAATNVDLEQAVKAGGFRSDLYYRLKVFPIRMPPLRERPEDIPALGKHFATKYAAQHRKPIRRIATATLRALAAYHWPGNVRELEHMIERAVILSNGPVLTVDELDQESRVPDSPGTPHKTLAEAERSHILETLRQTNWVLAGRYGAAARLGMKRSTLQHRMRKLGITRPAPSSR